MAGGNTIASKTERLLVAPIITKFRLPLVQPLRLRRETIDPSIRAPLLRQCPNLETYTIAVREQTDRVPSDMLCMPNIR